MSYTLSKSKRIPVSGSVSYPASEHGGTQYYHDNVDVTVNITVNTDPFDSSVFETECSIDALTDAVAVLEGAQIKAIRDNSDRIAKTIINGFYHTINSDLTAQQTEANSVLRSKFALLSEYSKELKLVKDRMERDTHRIYDHYHTLFQGIDLDMQERIENIERDSFGLTNKIRKRLLLGDNVKMASDCFDNNRNSGRVSRLMSSARIKKALTNTIRSISEYVTNTLAFRKNVDGMVDQKSVKQAEVEYVPTILFFTQDLNNDKEESLIIQTPEMNGKGTVLQGVRDFAGSFTADDFTQISTEDSEMINHFFMGYLEDLSHESDSDVDIRTRVQKKTLELWQAHRTSLMGLHTSSRECDLVEKK